MVLIDQQLTLVNNILSLENDDSDIDLSTYLNTDNQQLSIAGRRISLTNGSFVDLPTATVNTDAQQLVLSNTNQLSLTNGGDPISLTPFLDNTDNQALSINAAGTQITLERGGTINLPTPNGEVDGIIGNEIVNGTDGTLVRLGNGTTANPYTLDVSGGGIGNNELAVGSVQSDNIVNGTIELIDIQPSPAAAATTQIISSTAGVVAWVDIPSGGTGSTELADGTTIVGNGTTTDRFRVGTIGSGQITDGTIQPIDIQPSPAPAATTQIISSTAGVVAWVDIPSGGTGSTELADGTTIVGNGTTTDRFRVGTIGSGQITDGSVLLEDLNRNGAGDGQVLKWDASANGTLGGWIVANDLTSGTGVSSLTNGSFLIGNVTNTPTETVISGDATVSNTGVITISENAVGSNEIQLNSISADDIDTGAVTTDEILDLTIGTDDIALNAVTVEKIAEGTNGQVITTNAAGDVVWGIAQAGASTTTLRIGGDGTTLNPLDLADDAVNSAKIEDNTISADDIDTGAVTTDEVRWT